ncbi:hypothetical protein F7725_016735 [Dissostichus mawsoni]|uniref:Nucleolar protein 56 n=1 Tax=Dissostichus mawsoni TaxID=36200 RepID=A0A7J5Z2E7_DISMA|nr:hypothetical protein F7725_016735 [Dissostichus mawsoni]
MVLLHVLFEHAAGYALFAVKEVEEIGMLLPQRAEHCQVNSMVSLAAFFPFKSAQETNLPLSGKKKAVLGVSDSKVGASLQEEFTVSIQTGGVVAEISRGLRLHFHSLVKGLTGLAASKAQLGLGHSYSRSKVKFNVNRVDNMIIQSIALLDQLDKDINTFSMRVREWYGYHFPELVRIVPDNSMYCRMAQLIGNRKELSEENLESMEAVVMDGAKAQAILEASRSSMGMDISPIDLINIERFSTRVVALAEYRLGLQEYLRCKMAQVAPNLAALIGEVVGARLISHAGSLTNLAKYPASTVQILGAEKALFRYWGTPSLLGNKVATVMAGRGRNRAGALKTKGNTPKYGLIFHSTFIGPLPPRTKAASPDIWPTSAPSPPALTVSLVPTSVYGDKLRGQVEERLSFYETGDVPRKNLDVMKEAVKEATDVATEIKRKLEKKEKKRKKREKKMQEDAGETNGEAEAGNGDADTEPAAEEMEVEAEEAPAAQNGAEETPGKKKKKRKSEAAEVEVAVVEEETETPSKKKKKRKSEAIEAEPVEETETPVSEKKKKKKKKETTD